MKPTLWITEDGKTVYPSFDAFCQGEYGMTEAQLKSVINRVRYAMKKQGTSKESLPLSRLVEGICAIRQEVVSDG